MRNKIKRSLRVSRYVIYKETLIDREEHLWSFIGSFIGIGLIAFLQSKLLTESDNGTAGRFVIHCRYAGNTNFTPARRCHSIDCHYWFGEN